MADSGDNGLIITGKAVIVIAVKAAGYSAAPALLRCYP